MRRSLILLVALFALCAGSAYTINVTNNTSSYRMSDSLAIALNSLDSIGVWSTEDSAFVLIVSPRGVSFRDSGTIAGLTGIATQTITGRTFYYWKRQVSDLDSNWGAGQYSGVVLLKKNAGSGFPTPRFFEFNVNDTLSTNGVGYNVSRYAWGTNYTAETARSVNAKYWRGVIVPYFTGAGPDTLIPVKVVVNSAASLGAADLDNIRAAVLNAKAAAVTSGASDSSFVSTGLTQATGFWNNSVVMVLNGTYIRKAAIVKRSVLQGGQDTIVFTPKLAGAIGGTDSVLLTSLPLYYAMVKGILDSTASASMLTDSVLFRDSSSWAGKAGSTTGKLISKAATSATATISNAAMAAIGDTVINKQIIKALTRAVVVKQGAASGTPTTSKIASTAISEADNYWNDNMVVMITGAAAGQSARVTGTFNTGDSIQFAPAFTAAPSAADSFVILGLISEAGGAADTVNIRIGAANAILANTISVGNLRDTLNKYAGIRLGVTAAGSTTTSIVTNFTESATDYWKDALCVYIDGGLLGQTRRITGYNGTTKAFTTEAFTGSPATNDTFIVVPAGSGGTVSVDAAAKSSIADYVLNRDLDSGGYDGATHYARAGAKLRITGDSTRWATPAEVWRQKQDSVWPSGSMGEYMRLRAVASFAMAMKPAGVFGNYCTDPLFLSYDTALLGFTGGSGPSAVATYGSATAGLFYDLPHTYKCLTVSLTGAGDSVKFVSARASQINPGVYQYGVAVRKSSALAVDSLVVILNDSTGGVLTVIDSFVVYQISTSTSATYQEYTAKTTITSAKNAMVRVRVAGDNLSVLKIAYPILRGGGGADPTAIGLAVWNADTATFNNVAASYGAILATPAYVQGAAASVTDSSIVQALRAQDSAFSPSMFHRLAIHADSGVAGTPAATIVAAIKAEPNILSASTLTDVKSTVWTADTAAYNNTAASFGDVLSKQSYVGNVYTIGGSTDIVSGQGREAGALRDIFRSAARAPIYLTKLDILGDNGAGGSFSVTNSGGPGTVFTGATNSQGFVATAPGASGQGANFTGGAYGLLTSGATAALYGFSSAGRAFYGYSAGSNPTFEMHNSSTGWGGYFASDLGAFGLYSWGNTAGAYFQAGSSGVGLKATGGKGIEATSTGGGAGIRGFLDSVLTGVGGGGGGASVNQVDSIIRSALASYVTTLGSGSDTVVVYAIDTSLSPDQALQQVKLTIKNAAGNTVANAYTNTSGRVSFTLDPGTYNISAFRVGYHFATTPLVVIGPIDSISTSGYRSSRVSAGFVQAYVSVGNGIVDSVLNLMNVRSGVEFRLNLIGQASLNNGTNLIIPKEYKVRPDSTGVANFYIPANSSMTPSGSYYELSFRAQDNSSISSGVVRRFVVDTSSNAINIMSTTQVR